MSFALPNGMTLDRLLICSAAGQTGMLSPIPASRLTAVSMDLLFMSSGIAPDTLPSSHRVLTATSVSGDTSLGLLTLDQSPI